MEPVHNIVFFGETLPGYDRSVARIQLQTLLGCSHQTIHQVFSGQRVRLRKGLSAVEAQRYELRLKGIGLKVAIDPPLPPDMLDKRLSAARDDTTRSSASGLPQVVCPACGETQPLRTVCRACSINMPGFLAAQAAKSANAAQPQGAMDKTVPVASEFLGVGLNGRFGRGLMFQSFLVGLTAINLGLIALFTLGSMPLCVLAGVAGGFFKIRALIRRSHDLDWRGWVWLAQLVPVLGLYFTFKLAFWPGRADANEWGPHRRTSVPAFLLALAAYLGSLGYLAHIAPADAPLLPGDDAGAVFTRGAAPSAPGRAAG